MTDFITAAAVFIGLTFFVYFNYPGEWRRETMFNVVLILWHTVGTIALVTVFVFSRLLRHEGLKYEACRTATFYYLLIMLMSMFFALRLLITGGCRYLMKRTGRLSGPRRHRMIADKRVQTVVFFSLSFIMVTIGFFNIDILYTTEYDVSVDKPCQDREMTAVLIADIHAGSGTWGYTYDDLAERINEADPDLLLIAGDVFDETTSQRDEQLFRRTLEEIRRPRLGIYFVYGNHDDHTEDRAADQMRAFGAEVLEDEMTVLDNGIQLIGRMDQKYSDVDVLTLTERLDPDRTMPILMLAHRPRDFRKMADAGYDLAVAGHTHGFNIPQFLGSPVLEDMYYGIKKYGKMTAVTTSGVSAWGFHYKFPAKSEIVAIHLHFTHSAAHGPQ